jgi:hypothetical protein
MDSANGKHIVASLRIISHYSSTLDNSHIIRNIRDAAKLYIKGEKHTSYSPDFVYLCHVLLSQIKSAIDSDGSAGNPFTKPESAKPLRWLRSVWPNFWKTISSAITRYCDFQGWNWRPLDEQNLFGSEVSQPQAVRDQDRKYASECVDMIKHIESCLGAWKPSTVSKFPDQLFKALAPLVDDESYTEILSQRAPGTTPGRALQLPVSSIPSFRTNEGESEPSTALETPSSRSHIAPLFQPQIASAGGPMPRAKSEPVLDWADRGYHTAPDDEVSIPVSGEPRGLSGTGVSHVDKFSEPFYVTAGFG